MPNFVWEGCDDFEDANHLFLHYDFSRQIWNVLYNWLGFIMVNLHYISDHVIQFGVLGDFSKKLRVVFNLFGFSVFG